jgi:hypothetical protein
MRGWCSYSPTLRTLVRSGAFRLLCCSHLEERHQLLTHPSLLGGRCLRTAVQQHGCIGEVLRRPPEEWWGVGVSLGVGVEVSSLVVVSVIVACSSPGQRHWCTGSGLFGGWAVLLPLAVPLTGLLLHRDILCRLSVAGLWIQPQLLVKDVQLFVELALGLREFIELRLSLVFGGAVARCRLRVRASRGRCHADVALTRGVTLPRGWHPLERRKAGCGTSRKLVIDVGRHRIAERPGCPRGYIAVYRYMNSPQSSGSAPLA